MRGFFLRVISILLVFAFFIPGFAANVFIPVETARAASQPDYSAEKQWTVIEPSAVVSSIDVSGFSNSGAGLVKYDDGILLPINGAVSFVLDVPKEGDYHLLLEYRIDGDKVLKNTVTIEWEGDEIIAPIPALWKDIKKDYDSDRFGNQVIPEQVKLEGNHQEYVKLYAGLDKAPYDFQLAKGQHKFTLTNNTQPIILSKVYLVEKMNTPTYEEHKRVTNDKPRGSQTIIIEAEDYVVKSDSFIRSGNAQDSALYPYKTDKRLLNIIAGGSWKDAGQKILWEFKVDKPGLYKVAFRYNQGDKQGVPVFRNIEIDGYMPIAEMRSYPFPYNDLKYSNLVLESDGEPMSIWLDEGKHTIALEVDAARVMSAVEELKKIMLEINDTGIEIKKLIGSTSDKNRTWDTEQYMPDIVERLENWSDRINKVYGEIKGLSSDEPAYIVNLKVAEKNISGLAKEPNKIPNKLSKLSEGSGSAAQLLGDLVIGLTDQPLSLDRIYLFADEDLPKPTAGFMLNLWESIKSFILSFFAKNNSLSAMTSNKNELSVWVNRPTQYVEILQQLIDTDFTPNSKIAVNLSVMPDEQKLILSNASRTNPDAALSISSHIPYELAIRGAITDFTEFDDYFSYISREYNLETLIPYYIEGGIYGVTETQDFYVLMYRKDIMEKLKLPIPDTWDDVKEIMPELQRHSMNFFIPMAGWVGLKPFYTTAPFIFQSGGSIYTPDGLSTAFTSEETMKGFELMTELFSIYSLAENAPNFYNNFRYGTMPIGVANFGTYVMLMNAAPEIAGLWDIAPSPGVAGKDDVVRRYQAASDRADIIFANSDKKDESWELLKWWLSKETQIKFAYTMQTKFGPEYMWNTANMAAFEQLPFPENHKEVILDQWKWMKEVPRHPGGYMVEREISNAWTDIVMNGKGLRIAIDNAMLNANREIERKLEEFGYIKDGKVISEYPIPTIDDIRERVKEGR